MKNTNDIKLKVGSTYRTRVGDIVTIKGVDSSGFFESHNNSSDYFEDGTSVSFDHTDWHDIVSEIDTVGI